MIDNLAQVLVADLTAALIQAFFMVVVGILTTKFYQWTGIQIEDKHRIALQSAVSNAAIFAVGKASNGRVDTELALGYVKRSVPDAVAHFKASDEVLLDITEAKIHDVVNRTDDIDKSITEINNG